HQDYTIGQRRVGVALGFPAYVVAIDAAANTVTLGPEEELLRTSLEAEGVNWVSVDARPGDVLDAVVKIRYGREGAPARVTAVEGGRVRVEFAEPVRAVTPGQAAVFYRDDAVLGGGWIR
ncbi:MAG: aminomethyltransferase beta-barrel domain-containing protein, partial [Planctomycetota bacterium]